MTVIAHFNIGGIPIFIGDILLSSKIISGEDRLPKELTLPAGYVDTSIALRDGYLPVGYRQKIVILDDHIVMAWTGSTAHVDSIINGLRNAAEDRSSLEKSIAKYLDSLAKEITDEIAIVVIFMSDHSPGEFTILGGGGILKFSSPAIGEYLVAGSGTEHFNAVVDRLEANAYKKADMSHSLAASVKIVTSLLEIESFYKQSSPMSYGGAYEICYFDGKKFRKLDNLITAIFVMALDDDECQLYEANSFVHTHYQDDVLRITALLAGDHSTTPYLAVAKPYEDGFDPLPHNLEFGGLHHGYLFRVEWKGNFVINLTDIRLFEKNHPFSIEKVDGSNNLKVTFGGEWFQKILDAAKSSVIEKYPNVRFD